ncbi:MAG: hypothetical protein R6V06_01800 [Kiritimatiellia bacterium]
MSDIQRYKAKAAGKPLQFWMQPFLLLLLIGLLWRMLPVPALLFDSRVVRPLPFSHVSYVRLEPAFASEVMRMSMQSLRRTESYGGNVISFEAVEPYEAPGPPEFMEEGSFYPGKWSPDDVTPLAQGLPDLLCVSPPPSLYRESSPLAEGFRMRIAPTLRKAGFAMPDINTEQLPGTGTVRFFVETDEKGSVVHVILLDPNVEGAYFLERMLYQGTSLKPASGEITFMWRNP